MKNKVSIFWTFTILNFSQFSNPFKTKFIHKQNLIIRADFFLSYFALMTNFLILVTPEIVRLVQIGPNNE